MRQAMEKSLESMKEQADQDLQLEFNSMEKVTKMSIKLMHDDIKVDQLKLDEANIASLRSLDLEQKLLTIEPHHEEMIFLRDLIRSKSSGVSTPR